LERVVIVKMKDLVVLTVLALLCGGLVLPVSAATSTDTTYIQSNPVQGLVLDVTGNITTWDLSNIGDNIDNTDISMRIRSNTPWQINVYDALNEGKPAASAGHMTEYSMSLYGGYNTTDVGRMLYYPLELQAQPYDLPVVLSGAQQMFASGNPTPSGGAELGGLLYNLTVNQKLRFADARLPDDDAYRIVVTFVATNV